MWIDGLRLVPAELLRRFVDAHQAELGGLGPALDADPGRTLGALYPDALPVAVRDALDHVESLSEQGLVDVLIRLSNGALARAARDLDPWSFALVASLDQPDAFRRALDRFGSRRLRRYREFLGKVGTSPAPSVRDGLGDLTRRLRSAFEARGWGAHCDIELACRGDLLRFVVSHGLPVRREGAVELDRPSRRREPSCVVRYRPRQADLVVFESRRGLLKVDALDAETLHLYRVGFGELLLGDPDGFDTRPVVALSPLVHARRGALLPTEGLAEVRLVGVELALRGETVASVLVQADDVFDVLERHRGLDLRDGTLLAAALWVRGEDGRCGQVEVRPPNQVRIGIGLDEQVVEGFLEERGFLGRAVGVFP